MDTVAHTLPKLFEQLGLPADEDSIRDFVDDHQMPTATVKLHEAPWWNRSQRLFLLEAIENDAEWAPIVDELDAMLRHPNAA